MSPETIGAVLAAMKDTKQLRHAGSYREGWEDAVDIWGQRLEAAMKSAPERIMNDDEAATAGSWGAVSWRKALRRELGLVRAGVVEDSLAMADDHHYDDDCVKFCKNIAREALRISQGGAE